MATNILQRPRTDWSMPRGEFASPSTVRGASNWGTGVQPARTPVAAPAAPRTGRNLGTMTSADLNRSPTGAALNQRPALTGTTPTSGYAEYTPRPVSPSAPLAVTRPSYDEIASYAPGSFGRANAANNAGIYAPGSFGAQNAAANATGYRAPQQTERANPLSGDNNYPGESIVARPPFVQRGAGIPSGQDSLPAPIRTTLSEDDDIASSLNGTLGRIRGGGIARPNFGGSNYVKPADRMMRQLFSDDSQF
jgi:hypothetical protein